jgi:hypothetical protein
MNNLHSNDSEHLFILTVAEHFGVAETCDLPLLWPPTRLPASEIQRRPMNELRHLRILVDCAIDGTLPGVFLSGATERQAHRWAMRQARPFGGRVTAVDQHPGGRPHFHIEFPPGSPAPVPRSGHIFYGNPPAASFFEFDHL